MTNERAVEILNLDLDILGQYGGETAEAYKMAIKALEAQPCEDAVSRTLVHEAITASIAESENPYEMWQRIEALPPVIPKYTDEEIDKAQAVEQAYVDKMVELAAAETKRPKGKWIEIEIDAGEFIYKCTKCGMRVINPYKYCPICGSYNGGGEDEVNN